MGAQLPHHFYLNEKIVEIPRKESQIIFDTLGLQHNVLETNLRTVVVKEDKVNITHLCL